LVVCVGVENGKKGAKRQKFAGRLLDKPEISFKLRGINGKFRALDSPKRFRESFGRVCADLPDSSSTVGVFRVFGRVVRFYNVCVFDF